MLLQARDLQALRQRRLDEEADVRPAGHDPDTCTQGCCHADGWVTLEAAAALALSEHQVHRRLQTGERLQRYHHVAAAVSDGLLPSWTAVKLLEHLDALAQHVSTTRLAAIELGTVAWLTDRPRTVGRLNARMRRLLVQAREEDGSDDGLITSADRGVHIVPADATGLATLIARLPEVDAIAIAGTLRALAAEPIDAGDGRSPDQRVCDLFTASLTGLRAEHGRTSDTDLVVRGPGSFSVRLDVTIPASALVGRDAPVEIPGLGVVPASSARSAAALGRDDVRVRPLVYDPSTGRLVGAAHRHEPIDSQPRNAWLGNVVPYPRGATSVDNTCSLCRRHHRLKTHAPRWSLTMHADGTASWTTPAGRTLATDPADYSEPDPPSADTEDPEHDIPPF